MTRNEMTRRLSLLSDEQLKRAYRCVREGCSAHAVAREAGITLKQANALFIWQGRYGIVIPSFATLHYSSLRSF